VLLHRVRLWLVAELRLDQLLPPVSVAQLHGSAGTFRQNLNVGRVGCAADEQSRPSLRGTDLNVGSPLRSDQPKQHCLRVSSCAIRHLDGGICWQDRDACPDAPAVIHDFKRTPTEHWRGALRYDCARPTQREHQDQDIEDGEGDEKALSFQKELLQSRICVFPAPRIMG
jgi:hypothetical protein